MHLIFLRLLQTWNMNCLSGIIKDHVYRMVKVEGRCTQLMSSSLHKYIIIGWHKSIVSSDWSDTMVWFGQILLYLTFHILYIWSLAWSNSAYNLLWSICHLLSLLQSLIRWTTFRFCKHFFQLNHFLTATAALEVQMYVCLSPFKQF